MATAAAVVGITVGIGANIRSPHARRTVRKVGLTGKGAAANAIGIGIAHRNAVSGAVRTDIFTNTAVIGIGRSIDTGAAAVGQAGWTGQDASPIAADAIGAADAATTAAVVVVRFDIGAHPIAVDQRNWAFYTSAHYTACLAHRWDWTDAATDAAVVRIVFKVGAGAVA